MEFDLTLNAIQTKFSLSDERIEALKNGNTLSIDDRDRTLKINKKKRYSNSDFYALFTFTNPEKEKKSDDDFESRDFHYGLFILGTEKHESRRIDNQLRGRAGRQGDPGVSVFFVALDDLLMRKMGGERIKALAGMLLSKEELENLELTQKQFTKTITRAQKEIEAYNFSIRKHLFDYDSVINKQRLNIYHTRDSLIEADLDEEKKKEWLEDYKRQFLVDAQEVLAGQMQAAETTEQPISDLLEVLNKELGLEITPAQKEEFEKQDLKTLHENLERRLVEYFQDAFETINDNLLFNLFRDIHLHIIDKLRVNHMDEMQALKDKVGFMGYAQIDPLIMYKKESFEKFQELLERIKSETTTMLMRIDFKSLEEQQQQQIQIIEAQKNAKEIMSKLKNASNSAKNVKTSPSLNEQRMKQFQRAQELLQAGEDAREVLFEDEDGIEVFEADDANNLQDVSVINTSKKVRPNDPCPCGSGKKYKKCCGKED